MRTRAILVCLAVHLLLSGFLPCAQARPLSEIRADEEAFLKTIWKQPYGQTTRHYAMATDCGKEIGDLTTRTMELLYYNLKNRFGFEGDADKVRVIVFSKREHFANYAEEFLRMTPPELCIGVYSPMTKEIVAHNRDNRREQLVGVLMHEGTHQFIDLVTRTQPPLWVSEGIAVYFESSRWKGSTLDIGVVPRDRLKLLQEALKKDDYTPVKEFISSKETTLDLLGYAEAWGLVYFFVKADDGRYAGRFASFFKMLRSGTEGAKAFREAFEKDFGPQGYAALENRWKKFIREEVR